VVGGVTMEQRHGEGEHEEVEVVDNAIVQTVSTSGVDASSSYSAPLFVVRAVRSCIVWWWCVCGVCVCVLMSTDDCYHYVYGRRRRQSMRMWTSWCHKAKSARAHQTGTEKVGCW
jgi:hypothetical protein